MGEPRLDDPHSILDLLNYQLHVLLSFSTAEVVRLCEQEMGITRHEWGYIGLLAAFGPLSPSDLALRAGMDRSRTSKALMPLVLKGLVRRSAPGPDRRYAMVSLTPKGQGLYDRLFPRVLDIHRELISPLRPQEVRQLARIVDRLRRQAVSMQRRHPQPPTS